MSDSPSNSNLAGVRGSSFAGAEGSARDFWRSLNDLAAAPEFQDVLAREFPRQAMGWSEDEDPVAGRRNFLKLMGASMALAGMTACTRQPIEHIDDVAASLPGGAGCVPGRRTRARRCANPPRTTLHSPGYGRTSRYLGKTLVRVTGLE